MKLLKKIIQQHALKLLPGNKYLIQYGSYLICPSLSFTI